MKRLVRRRVAWILIVIVDAGLVAWGATAAAAPDSLLGPGGTPILTAGYEGYTKASWSELVRSSPATASYIEVVFRMYGFFNAIFGLTAIAIAVTAFRHGERWAWWMLGVGNTMALVAAMRYDWIVDAIGPFELTEYAGLGLVYVALAMTARHSREAVSESLARSGAHAAAAGPRRPLTAKGK